MVDAPSDRRLSLVFCGTPVFAVPSLDKLANNGFTISLVVTQPDRPRGRGMQLAHSPVKQRALDLGLTVAQPEKIKNNDDFRAALTSIAPDAIIVIGYGRIIPQWMIDLPRLGNINVHASLLPKYRGAAPIQWAIARGERVTGVTTMRIDTGLDTGDILLSQEVAIDAEDTAETLSPRLATVGADLLIQTLSGLQDGSVMPHPQEDAKATLAPILTKADGRIDFTSSATEIYNRLRGFQSWPGAFTTFRGKKLNVWKAIPTAKAIAAGGLCLEGERLLAGCAVGSAIELIEVQPEGKKRMSAADFIRGYRPLDGEKFGTGEST